MSSVKRFVERKPVDQSQSVYRVPISNSLGINALQARAQLKQFALTKPIEYSEMRNDVYIGVVKHMVETAHNTIWELLANGILPGGAPILLGKGGDEWSPCLPDQQIGAIANGYSESMMEAFEKVMTKILPEDYKSLSEDKIATTAKLENALRV